MTRTTRPRRNRALKKDQITETSEMKEEKTTENTSTEDATASNTEDTSQEKSTQLNVVHKKEENTMDANDGPIKEGDIESSQQEGDEEESGEFDGTAKNYMPQDRVAPLMTDELYIKERVDDQISYYNSKSSGFKNDYKKFKKLEIYIASMIPVIITIGAMGPVADITFGPEGSKWTMNLLFQIVAAIGGVVIVIITKFIELEEYFKLWKEYRETCQALQHERLLYLTRTEPYDEDDAFPQFVTKIEAILNNETQKWKQTVKNEPNKKPDQQVGRK